MSTQIAVARLLSHSLQGRRDANFLISNLIVFQVLLQLHGRIV
jgi:hypothetical protein